MAARASRQRPEVHASLTLCHGGYWFTWDPGLKRIQVRRDLTDRPIKSFPVPARIRETTDAATLLLNFRNECATWAETHKHEMAEIAREPIA